MSSTPTSAATLQPTSAPSPAPTATKPTSPYAVSAIPPFRAPASGAGLSYSQAIGGGASPAPSAGAKGLPVQPVVTNSHARNQSVSVKPDGSGGMSVAPSRVNQIRNAQDTPVAFGTSADLNSILSSSPAAPPSLAQNGPPKSFGTLPAQNNSPSASPGPSAATPSHPKINLHSFFSGNPSPSPSPSQAPRPMPATFVPGQSFNPQKPSTPTFQPQRPQTGGPLPQRPGQGPPQGSFNSQQGGPASPRMPNMYAPPPQSWQQQPQYGYAPPPPQGYYQYPQPLPQQSLPSSPGGNGLPPPHHPSTPQQQSALRPTGMSFSPSVAEFKPSSSTSSPSPSLPQQQHSHHQQHHPHALSIGGAVDGPAFQMPKPRVSAAIKIRNPKLEKEKKDREDAEAAAKKAAEDKEKAVADEGVKKAEDDKVKAEKKKEDDDASAKVEAEKVEKAAAVKKEEDDKAAAAADKKAKDDAEAEKVKAEKEAALQKQKDEDAKTKAAEAEAENKKAAAEKKQKDEDDAAAAQKQKDDADAKAKEEELSLAAKAKEQASLAADKVKEEAEAASSTVTSAAGALVGAATSAISAVVDAVTPASADETKDESKAESKDESKDDSKKDEPKVNGTSSTSEKRVPSALDLSSTKASDATPSLPSALSTAAPISELSTIAYPSNIKSPRADLNVAAEPGKYRYDREFLMQFMSVCIEKPDLLPNLEAIGMVDASGSGGAGPAAGGFTPGSRRTSSMGPPAMAGRGGSGGGFGRSGGPASGMGNFGMGNFGAAGGAGGAIPNTSEARFAASSAGGARAVSGAGGAFGQGVARPMSRTPSQGGPGGAFGPPQGRSASGRGMRRDGGGGGGKGGRGPVPEGMRPGQHVAGEGFEDAKLVATENRWMPSKLGGAEASDANSPEMVQRKVKALLNKLTLERFDSISDQILAWANKSIDEEDGRILRQVIALIFEKATDEANWSEMYARLCRKLMEVVSPEVKDVSVKGPDGAPVAGGALFRKYLLNRCQEDYEAGWKQKEASAAAAAGKAADDHAKKEANDAALAAAKEAEESGTAPSSSEPKEAELLSDEYYAAQKAKRRGLGLVRFIGELYRLHMLTERIMHECIKKLLANTDSPEEEDVESLCRLLTTVGKMLDNAKAKQHMDIYFSRMKLIANNQKISSRMRFMIQDVLELRSERWEPRNVAAGPKLISEIHADAQKAAEDSARRTASSTGKGLPRLSDQMSRPNSGRGGRRDQFGVPAAGADGFTAVPQRPAKAGDLSGFGKIRESSAQISLGPSGAFANRAAAKKEASRPPPSNPYALLAAQEEAASAASRPKLVLAPRTKPLEGEEGADGEGEAKTEGEGEEAVEEEDEDDGAIDPNAISMSKAEAERRSGNSVKEFFSVKSISEGVASVEALPAEYRGLLITLLSETALQKKAEEVNITRQLFAEVLAKSVLSHDKLLLALEPIFKGLMDVQVDVPNAYSYASHLALGAGATREEVETLAQKMESEEEEEEEVEHGRTSLLAAFDKLQQ